MESDLSESRTARGRVPNIFMGYIRLVINEQLRPTQLPTFSGKGNEYRPRGGVQ